MTMDVTGRRLAGCLTVVAILMMISAAGVARGATALDRIVAVVNDDVVTMTELDREVETIKARLQDEGIPVPVDNVLRSQVLDRLIMKRLQLQLAERNGIRVDDETLNRTIQRIADQNGMSLSQFRNAIERDGFSFVMFREDIRDEITISRLKRRHVDSRVIVTEQEIDQFIANEMMGDNAKDEFHLAHILIAVSESAGPDDIRAARDQAEEVQAGLQSGKDFRQMAIEHSDGQQALDGGDLGWRKAGELPTLFARVVPNMEVGEVSKIIRSPSGFHIVKLVDRHSGERHLVTEYQARHILIKPNELVTDAGAREQLLSLRRRIDGGEEFAALARAFSEDKATAVEGGDLGWVKPGELAPRFASAMETLQPGEISMPFKSRFGWHIVQVMDKRRVDDTEEFNRTKARQVIHERKVEEEYRQWVRRLRDQAYVVYRSEKD